MDDFNQRKIYFGYLVLGLICLVAGRAPFGCTFSNGKATCDFTRWNPPLEERDFGPGDICCIVLENVDGDIPTRAFEDVDGPADSSKNTYIEYDCSNNDINLNRNTFTSNLNWVKKLYFKSCDIQNGLEADIFDDLSGLTYLEINKGSIGSLRQTSLRGLANLASLKIRSDFPSNKIPGDFLTEIPNVESIDFQSAGLTSFDADAFSGLSLLVTLDLSRNSLRSLDEDSFIALSSLKTLDLSRNSITSLPKELFKSQTTSFKTLDLSRNSLQTLPDGLFDSVTSLKQLDLSRNSITSLPTTGFGSLNGSLESLDLSSNSLETLIAGNLDSLSSLTVLTLSQNALTNISDGTFSQLHSLQTLDLTENSLPTLPGGLFESQTSLKTLEMSKNSLNTLPGELFNSLSALTSLDLSTNSLTNLSTPLFDSLAALVTLDLSDNSLLTLSDGLFDSLVNVNTLDMSNNNLSTLPDGLFLQMLSLSTVSLTGNSWNCTCTLVWLSTWSLYTGVSVGVDCSSPAAYTGRKLILAMKALNCTSSHERFTTSKSTTIEDPSADTVADTDADADANKTWQYVEIGLTGTAIVLSSATMIGMCATLSRLHDIFKKGNKA